MNYQKHYESLTNRALVKRSQLGYLERHHIIPRCMGGLNSASNICYLTPEEHFLAHLLLIKIYPQNSKLVFAIRMMTAANNKMQRPNNKLFGWIRRRWHEQITVLNRSRALPLTEKHKRKISKTKKSKNLKWTADQREKRLAVETARVAKFSKTISGRTLSVEHKRKLSEAGKLRTVNQRTREILRTKALSRTEEQKSKRYAAMTSPESIEKYRAASANKVWMIDTRTKKTSFVNKELVQDKLSEGWILGRSIKE